MLIRHLPARNSTPAAAVGCRVEKDPICINSTPQKKIEEPNSQMGLVLPGQVGYFEKTRGLQLQCTLSPSAPHRELYSGELDVQSQL